jgi:dihydrofolate reductase
MAKVILGMTISLDGFANDRNGEVSRLYTDLAELRDTEMLQEPMRTTGAVVMGRRAYEMAQGDFTGYEFQTPIFVVTHEAPDVVAKGENDKLKFVFVTDGVESAIRQAKAAAGDRNVYIIGGVSTFQQCLRVDLIDELHIDIMPVLLGDGLRLFEHLGAEPIELEKIKVVEALQRTELQFRVVKK